MHFVEKFKIALTLLIPGVVGGLIILTLNSTTLMCFANSVLTLPAYNKMGTYLPTKNILYLPVAEEATIAA